MEPVTNFIARWWQITIWKDMYSENNNFAPIFSPESICVIIDMVHIFRGISCKGFADIENFMSGPALKDSMGLGGYKYFQVINQESARV